MIWPDLKHKFKINFFEFYLLYLYFSPYGGQPVESLYAMPTSYAQTYPGFWAQQPGHSPPPPTESSNGANSPVPVHPGAIQYPQNGSPGSIGVHGQYIITQPGVYPNQGFGQLISQPEYIKTEEGEEQPVEIVPAHNSGHVQYHQVTPNGMIYQPLEHAQYYVHDPAITQPGVPGAPNEEPNVAQLGTPQHQESYDSQSGLEPQSSPSNGQYSPGGHFQDFKNEASPDFQNNTTLSSSSDYAEKQSIWNCIFTVTAI